MTRYYLEITVRRIGTSRSAMEDLFEPLADAVCELTGVIDADIGMDLSSGTVDFTMAVDAADEVSALSSGLTAVRTALHAVGESTPSWDDHFETIKQVVSRESALSAA